jgi:hypothetical protein
MRAHIHNRTFEKINGRRGRKGVNPVFNKSIGFMVRESLEKPTPLKNASTS